MSYGLPPDVEQMVKDQIASGQYDSEDDVLRDALRSLTEEQEHLAAVEQAIVELKAGDEGIPVREAFEALREKHKLPPRP